MKFPNWTIINTHEGVTELPLSTDWAYEHCWTGGSSLIDVPNKEVEDSFMGGIEVGTISLSEPNEEIIKGLDKGDSISGAWDLLSPETKKELPLMKLTDGVNTLEYMSIDCLYNTMEELLNIWLALRKMLSRNYLWSWLIKAVFFLPHF